MEEKLWRIFENVNRWLDSAERKNTILLTFIGIQLTVGKTFIKFPNGWLIAASIFLGICFLITLISFFPQTFIPEWIYFWAKHRSLPQENDNLLFFGDISKYSLPKYVEKLEKYLDAEIRPNRQLMDICSQILINSQIATRKYNMFKASTWLMIVGQVLFLISFWAQSVMGLHDILNELNQEIKSLTSSEFSLEVTQARQLPGTEDSGLTFENFDRKSKSVKLIETCVLYVDIRKSTQLSFQHQPKTLAKLYSSFVRGIIRCAEYYDGRVRNIIGDRVMILFDPQDCFKNAANTAILINTFASYILNRHFKYNEVSCGIGIDHGQMLVTKIGTIKRGAERSDYRSLVWLGTPANIASKLTDIANKKIPRTTVSVGKYYPLINDWSWSEKEIDEFFEGMEMTYSQPIIARFKEPFVQSFFKSVAYRRYRPILMTKKVYLGFKRACPDEQSIRKKWWSKKYISIEGYKGIAYDGDVIFTYGRKLN